MKLVLLAGGLGTRLWSMSTKRVPTIFNLEPLNQDSMLVTTYNKLLKEDFDIYVATIKKQNRFVKKQLGKNIKIKYLKIMTDKNISYQYHKFRDEIWYISSGNGIIIIDGKRKK